MWLLSHSLIAVSSLYMHLFMISMASIVDCGKVYEVYGDPRITFTTVLIFYLAGMHCDWLSLWIKIYIIYDKP